MHILSADTSSEDAIFFDTNNKLCVTIAGTARLVSTAAFRDPCAWGLLRVVYDAANGTNNLKLRVFWNDVEITAWDTDTRSGITTGTAKINHTVAHNLGRNANGSTSYYDGYMAEPALKSSVDAAWGTTTDTVTNIPGPVMPLGALWFLDFSDNSGTTSTTLGKDRSGNGNNWTPNNFSVSAGLTNDSFTDSPTNYGNDSGAGGEVRGNFAVMNWLDRPAGTGASPAFSDGNLTVANTSDNLNMPCRSTLGFRSGKIRFEQYIVTTKAVEGTGGYHAGGFCPETAPLNNPPGANAGGGVGGFGRDGTVNADGVQTYSTGVSTWAQDDIYTHLLDIDNGKYYLAKNGTWLNSANPDAGTGYVATITTTGKEWYACAEHARTAEKSTFNFGQRPWQSTPANCTSFKAMCTQNKTAPSILRADDYFAINLRTGTGASFNVTGKRFQPDLVFGKGRSGTTDWYAYDATRGVQKDLGFNLATDETTQAQGVTAFNSDGFSGGTLAKLNTNAATYVNYLIKKGAHFDIVTYTGNGSNRTIAHALGVAPSLVIIKSRTTAGSDTGWPLWSNGLANTEYILMNTAGVKVTGATTFWNSTSPTSSVFSLGTAAEVNANGDTYVAYVFADTPGFFKAGAFTGNANADGPFVPLGFRPSLVSIKNPSGTNRWWDVDGVRNSYNPVGLEIDFSATTAEASTTGIDIVSNGFKLRELGAALNSANAMLYFAFGEFPFKYGRAR